MACITARSKDLMCKEITVYRVVRCGTTYRFHELQTSGKMRISGVFILKRDLTTILITLIVILEQARKAFNTSVKHIIGRPLLYVLTEDDLSEEFEYML